MNSNLFTILSEIVKQQLLGKIVFDGKQLEEISKATGISVYKLVKILSGKGKNLTIFDLSNLFDYFDYKILSIVAFHEYKKSLSFEFQIDENFFSLN